MVRIALALIMAMALSGCAARPEEPALATVYDEPAQREVEVVMQDDHPAGCEICVLQSALAYCGYHRTFDEVHALFRHSDVDFVTAWWGDPMTEGAAYPPAMASAANRALSGTAYRALDITGCTLEGIRDALGDGGIVLCWFTTDYAQPRWTGWWVGDWQMYANEHCILVYGIAGGTVYAMDPLRGKVAMDVSTFNGVWTACGSMAVEIR